MVYNSGDCDLKMSQPPLIFLKIFFKNSKLIEIFSKCNVSIRMKGNKSYHSY